MDNWVWLITISMYSESWVWWFFQETADTWAWFLSSGKSEESFLTPWGTPWVLKGPVVSQFGISAVTYNQNTVVEVSTAWGWVDNTTSVELEDHLVSFDGNGDWSLLDCSFHLWWAVGSNISVSLVLDSDGEFLARATLSSVWVSSFGGDTVVSNVLEGVVHKTTIATQVTVWLGAVNQLLFRERYELASGDGIHTFEWASGWEGPAWSAWSLVLDWGNSVLISPVDWISTSWLKDLEGVHSLGWANVLLVS